MVVISIDTIESYAIGSEPFPNVFTKFEAVFGTYASQSTRSVVTTSKSYSGSQSLTAGWSGGDEYDRNDPLFKDYWYSNIAVGPIELGPEYVFSGRVHLDPSNIGSGTTDLLLAIPLTLNDEFNTDGEDFLMLFTVGITEINGGRQPASEGLKFRGTPSSIYGSADSQITTDPAYDTGWYRYQLSVRGSNLSTMETKFSVTTPGEVELFPDTWHPFVANYDSVIHGWSSMPELANKIFVVYDNPWNTFWDDISVISAGGIVKQKTRMYPIHN